MFKGGTITIKEKLESSTEEADSRLIQHLIVAAECESQRVVVIYNDTYVLVYCLIYQNSCQFYGCKEAGETRDIPIHVLAKNLKDHLSSSIILKTHVVTECDVTGKIWTKSSAMKNIPERFLEDVRIWKPSYVAFKSAEHYLVNVIQTS